MKKVLTLSKSICRTTLFFLVALAMSSCIDERIDDGSSVVVQEGIRLSVANANDVSVYSVATANENRIEDCYVVTFNGSGTFQFCDKMDVSKIIGNGSASPILPQTSIKLETGWHVYVICNTGVSAAPTGITEANINSKFPVAKTYYVGGDALPMSGSTTSYSNSNSTIVMTRAVAKVQVQMGTNVSDNTASFTLANVTWNVANYGSAKSPILPPTTITTAPGTAKTTNNSRLLQYEGGTEAQTTIYIPECEEYGGHFNKAHQCIIIKKNYSGKDYFYRLDFLKDDNGGNVDKYYYGAIRNYFYLFTINKVMSEGYLTEAEALANPGSNIIYTVLAEDNGFKQVVSDGQYALLLESDEMEIEGTTGTLRLSTVIPPAAETQITTHNVKAFDKNGNQVGGVGQALEFTSPAQTEPSYTANETPQSISFKINNLSLMSDGYLEVRLGNILKKVKIKYAVAARAKVVWMNGSSTDPADCVIKFVSPTTISGATNLSASGTSNCYVVLSSSEDKTYCFDANTMGNGASGVTALNQRTALAGSSITVDGFTVYKDAHISNDLEGAKVYFTVSKNQIGNALISVMDNSNNVCWSWHIWVVDPREDPRTSAHTETYTFTAANRPNNPNVISNFANNVWPTLPSLAVMDRNLGAMTADTVNPNNVSMAGFTATVHERHKLTHGLLYGWGFPTPMIGTIGSPQAGDFGVTTVYNQYSLAAGSMTAVAISDLYTSTNTSFASSIAHPELGPMGTTNQALWGATSTAYVPIYTVSRNGCFGLKTESTAKSVFDPCPVGYCMPPDYMLSILDDGLYTITNGFGLAYGLGYGRNIYYNGIGSGLSAFYSCSRDMTYRIGGSHDGTGVTGTYWLSSASQWAAAGAGSYLACGTAFDFYVRCVRE